MQRDIAASRNHGWGGWKRVLLRKVCSICTGELRDRSASPAIIPLASAAETDVPLT
jgi:hypothetical protein